MCSISLTFFSPIYLPSFPWWMVMTPSTALSIIHITLGKNKTKFSNERIKTNGNGVTVPRE
jgi:hypothetical protein